MRTANPPKYAKSLKTRAALIDAAGELFAEHGLDGASVRDIIKKAGTTLSAVNYHFGSKEGLYLATIRFVFVEQMQPERIFLSEDPSKIETREQLAILLQRIVQRMFHAYLDPQSPAWYGRLLLRAAAERHPEAAQMVTETLLPIRNALQDIWALHLPDLDPLDVDCWIFSLFGVIHHYLMSIRVVNLIRNHSGDGYDMVFLDHLCHFACRAALAVLGLPIPEAEVV